MIHTDSDLILRERRTLSEPTAMPLLAKSGEAAPAIWFRVLLLHGSVGPGKMDLLRLVDQTGSVSAAAKQLKMSHARSVKLVAELNRLGPSAVIATRSGGPAGGGAVLTNAGRRLLDNYARLDEAVRTAAAPHLKRLALDL